MCHHLRARKSRLHCMQARGQPGLSCSSHRVTACMRASRALRWPATPTASTASVPLSLCPMRNSTPRAISCACLTRWHRCEDLPTAEGHTHKYKHKHTPTHTATQADRQRCIYLTVGGLCPLPIIAGLLVRRIIEAPQSTPDHPLMLHPYPPRSRRARLCVCVCVCSV